MRAAWLVPAIAGLAALPLACNFIIGVDGYRACDGAECIADASSSDAQVESTTPDSPLGCSVSDAGTSVGCSTSAPVCSHGACVAIQSLGQGTSEHACAVLVDGHVRCWGANDSGQLGNGTLVAPLYPVEVTGLDSVVQVGMGVSSTCALRANGDVYCWGDGSRGQLAQGVDGSQTPVKVAFPGSATAKALSVGPAASCAITTGGLYCWGDGSLGNIGCPPDAGAGPFEGAATLFAPTLPWPVTHMAIGVHMSCFSGGDDNDGGVKCFGDNIDGMGDGRYIAGSDCISSQPLVLDVGMAPIPPLAELSASEDDVCGTVEPGAISYCWGGDLAGQVTGVPGQGQQQWAVLATVVPSSSVADNATHVSSGLRHTCATSKSANATIVSCWGASDHKQLGPANGPSAQLIPGIDDPVALAAHEDFSCVLQGNGRVLCWGAGSVVQSGVTYYELGNGDDSDQPVPVSVVW